MSKVQLTGYQGPRGFKPSKVYDPSQKILNQGNQLVQNMERVGQQMQQNAANDLKALADFSSTLQTTLADAVKRKSEQEYKLGLADVMNGNAEIPEGMKDAHQQKVETLRLSADADGEVANKIEAEGNLPLAEEFRANSRAISGWRAYGQAVGTAKKAALSSQAFIAEFMTLQEAIIPTQDGPKSPAEIAISGSQEEIEAAMAVAQQRMFEKDGLSGINPIVLAEHFAPTFNTVRAQAKANITTAVAANRREEAQLEIANQVQMDTLDEKTVSSDDMTNIFQQATRDYMNRSGLPLGKASALALTTMVESIKLLPPDQAREKLEQLKGAIKVTATGQTLGELEKDVFLKAEAEILAKERQLDAAQLQVENREVAALSAQLAAVRAEETDPQKLATAEATILNQLQDYALKGNTNALIALTNERTRTLLTKEQALFNEMVQSGDYTLDDVEKADLPEELKKTLRTQATDRARTQFEKDYASLVKQSTSSILEEKAEYTFDVNGKPSEHPEVYAAYKQSVQDKLFGWFNGELQKGNLPTADEVSAELEKITTTTYNQYYDRKNQPRALVGFTTTNNAKGERVFNAVNLRPEQIDSRYSHPSVSILLSANETQANLERFRDGQQHTGRVRDARVTGGMDTEKFLRTQAIHHGIDPTPYLDADRGESESANQAADPAAANAFYSADTDEEVARASQQLVEAKQRQERLQQLPAEGVIPTTDILSLALNEGFSERDAIILTAIALAESSGEADAHNDDRSTGDDSYGLWQINMLDEPDYPMGKNRAAALGLGNYEELKDPSTNARAMKMIYDQQGFEAWSVYTSGAYKQFLPDAKRALIALQQQG